MSFKNHSLPEWLTYRRIFIIILVLNITTRLILLSRPIPYLDGKLMPDDTYLSLEVARNIAHGKGPLYSDNYTNGFQPLYVFLMVPAFELSSDQTETPIKAALLMLSVFDAATLSILLMWVWSLTGNRIVLLLTGIFWIFNDYVIRTSLNGLETIIASFFIVTASWYFYHLYYRKTERSNLNFLGLGLITGFACFSRVDSGVLAAIIGILILIRERSDFSRMFTRAALYGTGVIAIFSIWVAYSMHYTGEWYPESGKAVRFLSLAHVNHNPTWKWYADMILRAGYQELMQKGFFIVLIIVLMVYGIRRKIIDLSLAAPVLPLSLFCMALLLAYTLYIFTPWYFDRYFFPLTMLYILILAILLNRIAAVMNAQQHTIVHLVIGVAWFAFLLADGQYPDYFLGGENRNAGYRNLGIWAKTNLPAGTVVGSSQSGALSYFAPELKVINLDGVVNKECFISLQEGRNMEYIREKDIEYIFGWENNIEFIRQHSKNFRESDLVFIKVLDGFRSWDHDWYFYKVNNPDKLTADQ